MTLTLPDLKFADGQAPARGSTHPDGWLGELDFTDTTTGGIVQESLYKAPPPPCPGDRHGTPLATPSGRSICYLPGIDAFSSRYTAGSITYITSYFAQNFTASSAENGTAKPTQAQLRTLVGQLIDSYRQD
jgi:hypothetical protein